MSMSGSTGDEAEAHCATLQEGLGISDGETFRAQPPPFPEGFTTMSSAEP